MNHIVCFHLYNDYSGSPKVLKMVLEEFLKRGYVVDLVTSGGGVLDELKNYDNLRVHTYPYKFSNNALFVMLRYCLVQLYTFFLSFRWLFCEDVVFYINTLLPAGPAFAGKLMRKKVVYHYHENAFVKGYFYRSLAWIMQKLADEIICVSAFQASFLSRKKQVMVISNAIPKKFVELLKPDKDASFARKRVLMLGSLKLYKSPLEFIHLAQQLSQFSFELVINDVQDNINKFISDYNIKIPNNLIIYSRQNNVVPFYNRASLVLNLTNSEMSVETFGLTALEAMSAGLPVIVPTVGGISELVIDGVNGYKIDVKDLDKISDCICSVLTDRILYMKLSENALYTSKRYSADAMIESILSLFQ